MQTSLKMHFTVQAMVALLLPPFYKLISNAMYVPTNKHPISSQNSLSLLSLLYQGEDKKTFSHFKSLHEQLDAVSTATCCP
jgi:hypothetical protein